MKITVIWNIWPCRIFGRVQTKYRFNSTVCLATKKHSATWNRVYDSKQTAPMLLKHNWSCNNFMISFDFWCLTIITLWLRESRGHTYHNLASSRLTVADGMVSSWKISSNVKCCKKLEQAFNLIQIPHTLTAIYKDSPVSIGEKA